VPPRAAIGERLGAESVLKPPSEPACFSGGEISGVLPGFSKTRSSSRISVVRTQINRIVTYSIKFGGRRRRSDLEEGRDPVRREFKFEEEPRSKSKDRADFVAAVNDGNS